MHEVEHSDIFPLSYTQRSPSWESKKKTQAFLLCFVSFYSALCNLQDMISKSMNL